LGMDVDIHPTDGLYNIQKFYLTDLIVPDTRNIVKWENLMHEIIGVIVYKLYGYS